MLLASSRCEAYATSLNRTKLLELGNETKERSESRQKPVGHSPPDRLAVTAISQRHATSRVEKILKFLVKLGKTFTEAYTMVKEVYGNECLSRTQVFEWFKRFKERRETTEDEPRPGRPSTSKTKTLKKMVNQSAQIVV
ncbi:hypothetical protein NQ318_001994 [Aromia moschata]|uniref:Mos1 transposase HTH domain-containing protein n=1 Tax=Aromia moschata TaxID=1265417 RepID=A0AAV8Z1Q0_9CUCU|nr:hypothetical protein NQ318_001994 [Aromia moschata]